MDSTNWAKSCWRKFIHTHRTQAHGATYEGELPDLTFEALPITDVFESMTASKAWYDKSKLNTEGVASYPFVSRSKADNGIDGFCSLQDKKPESGNAITIGLDTQTVGFQLVPFYTSQNIQILRHPNLTLITAPILMATVKTQLRKFSWGGNGATLGRLKATKIMVPTTHNNDGRLEVDWEGMDQYGRWLATQIDARIQQAVATPPCSTLDYSLHAHSGECVHRW